MKDWRRWEVIFDLVGKKVELEKLEKEVSASNFWSDNDRAQKILKERAQCTSIIDKFNSLQNDFDNLKSMLELLSELEDEELTNELILGIRNCENSLSAFELTRMLSGQHDSANAIMEINSGAGGTEAQDWGEMLLRMYIRWAERREFQAELLDVKQGEEAGIKSAVLSISGQNVFGYLRSERGVHRLVRISPFDSNARRHTSFASVSVMPDIERDVEIEVREEDLRVDTYRSSGAGGQHVNKTDSAVRITHIPSGIAAACQNSRSQHKNKEMAMRLLKSKLYDLELKQKQKELEKIAGERRKIDFGSQIRSYVMQPYQMVKDTRTSAETSNVQAVLDGDIDIFIEAYLANPECNNSANSR